MPSKTKSKSTTPASSWWKERSKIVAKTTESKPKAKRASAKKTKKAGKAEKGEMYYCEVCGSEVVCVEDSAGSITCCEEPMCLVC
ncbi:Uncharacterised protein [uncultured archaeon]|nr:Uncharacterised protein [uncultured archaeon]